ncbi:hypothetical protein EDB83DRAFT_2312381 [Lactarius deliciosus]|nr:hypothetical protein EDB83DRAFT_2312381 [Lactarius deliciosus]
MVLQGHTKDVLSYQIYMTSTFEVERLLHAWMANRVTSRAIQAILDHTPNITSLVLQLSFRCFHVFPNVTVFENLINLKVNIPHVTMTLFLHHHPLLKSLSLGPCGNSRRCPLCMSALTSGNLISHLATTYNGVGHTCFPIIKAFNFSIIGTFVLTTLHTDFDHTSAKLLHCISAVALVLINLKLTESKFSDKNACVQMLQDEADTWEDGLQSLPFLK